MEQWYFAYGSNLWREQMLARTGSIRTGDRQPRRARLPNYRVAFNMQGGDGQVYANIVPKAELAASESGSGVLGVIYWCGPAALEKLDVFENGYDRLEVRVIDANGDEQAAVAYLARPERVTAEGRPSAAYLQKIVTGAREQGLPEEYIRAIEARAQG